MNNNSNKASSPEEELSSSPTRRLSSSPTRRLSSSPTRRSQGQSSSPCYIKFLAQGKTKKTHYPEFASTNSKCVEVIELETTTVSQIGNIRLGPNLIERHKAQVKFCNEQKDEEACNKEKVILKKEDKNLCRWDQERKKCVIN